MITCFPLGDTVCRSCGHSAACVQIECPRMVKPTVVGQDGNKCTLNQQQGLSRHSQAELKAECNIYQCVLLVLGTTKYFVLWSTINNADHLQLLTIVLINKILYYAMYGQNNYISNRTISTADFLLAFLAMSKSLEANSAMLHSLDPPRLSFDLPKRALRHSI